MKYLRGNGAWIQLHGHILEIKRSIWSVTRVFMSNGPARIPQPQYLLCRWRLRYALFDVPLTDML